MTTPYLRELLDLGCVKCEVREAVVFEKDGRLVRKALKSGYGGSTKCEREVNERECGEANRQAQ